MLVNDPRTGTMKAGSQTCTQQGLILHVDGTNTLELTAATDVALFISAGEQERDVSGLVAGGSVGYYTLGGVLMVASRADAGGSEAEYTVGGFVYVGANGLATSEAASNKKLGIYVGPTGLTVGTAGDLIAVDTSFAEKA
tara:strand:- start:114 stop:533 length:420 start_codon:yes stop_codon:yes gene_type:complete